MLPMTEHKCKLLRWSLRTNNAASVLKLSPVMVVLKHGSHCSDLQNDPLTDIAPLVIPPWSPHRIYPIHLPLDIHPNQILSEFDPSSLLSLLPSFLPEAFNSRHASPLL